MNKGLVFGILLFGLAALSQAVTTVSCTGTYNMGTTTLMTFNSCAMNELIPGAGGSTVLTSNSGDFCVKTTKFYIETHPFSDHVINVKLLDGATCAEWTSGYCYSNPSACNKDMVPGDNFQLGEPGVAFIVYHYLLYQNAYGDSLQPFPAGMLYSNTITAPPGKCAKAQPAYGNSVAKAKAFAPRSFVKR